MIAEEAVLGSILKEPYLIKDTSLQPIHLVSTTNKNILAAMRKLDEKDKPIDLVGILTTGDPDQFGGAANLQRIQALANPKKFDDHISIVMDQWREREKQNILEVARQEDWDIEKIKVELDNLTNDKTDDYSSIRSLLVEVSELPWQEVEQKGVPTGLEPVDRLTGGWQNKDLIIIAARPSMGKTDVMLHFAKHAGWHGYLPIVFSLEMAKDRLRDRLLASVGNYDRGKFKNLNRFLSKEEKNRWTQVVGRVDNTNMDFYDQSAQTLADIRLKVRKSINNNPDKQAIVFVDYLTLIKPMDDMGGNKHLQVGEISKGLKNIARDFDCPVIVLAQLSRDVERRPDKRPMLSDLRESGSIEEDADIVLFLYRDSYYTKDDQDNSLELLFAKQRNGETGMIKTYYDKNTGTVAM